MERLYLGALLAIVARIVYVAISGICEQILWETNWAMHACVCVCVCVFVCVCVCGYDCRWEQF